MYVGSTDGPPGYSFVRHLWLPCLANAESESLRLYVGCVAFCVPLKEAVSSRSMQWPSERRTRVKSIEGSVVRVAWVLHAPEGISKLWPQCSKFGHRLWYRDLAPFAVRLPVHAGLGANTSRNSSFRPACYSRDAITVRIWAARLGYLEENRNSSLLSPIPSCLQ